MQWIFVWMNVYGRNSEWRRLEWERQGGSQPAGVDTCCCARKAAAVCRA